MVIKLKIYQWVLLRDIQDNRYHIVLSKMNIDTMKFYNMITKIKQCMKQLLLWYANMYFVPNEAFDMPHTINVGRKAGSPPVGAA